jgi:hypothetical protein
VVANEQEYRRLPGTIETYRAALALARGEPLGAIRHARRALELAPAGEHRWRASASGLMAIAFWGSGDLEGAYSAWAECAAGLRRAGPSPVAPAARSPKALAKAAAKRTGDDLPVHSFASLLTDLATICLNTITPADPALPGFRLVTIPTAVQRHAFDLLGVSHRLGAA